MSKRRLIDTNLIVRYLVQDHEEHAKAAEKLFDACDRGEITLIILPAVFAECVFVLESFYKHPRPAIANALSKLITSPGIEVEHAAIYTDALARYRSANAPFVDCIIASTAAADGLPVATFDQDFRKFTDVQVKTD